MNYGRPASDGIVRSKKNVVMIFWIAECSAEESIKNSVISSKPLVKCNNDV